MYQATRLYIDLQKLFDAVQRDKMGGGEDEFLEPSLNLYEFTNGETNLSDQNMAKLIEEFSFICKYSNG